MEHQAKVLICLGERAKMPHYASEHAAGADLYASNSDPITIHPSETALIPTGLYFEIPPGYEIQLRPRSGLALKHGITLLNTPGTIDADYRGEVMLILINHGKHPFIVEQGMRMAQMILAKVEKAEFVSSFALSTTERAEGGFGHTGA